MATANLTNDTYELSDGLDSIIVIKDLGDIPGGRTLNVDSVASDVDVIKAGHIIMRDDTSGDYEPLAVSAGAYTTTTTGKTYIGVLKQTVLKTKAFAPILTMGQVNKDASPYEVTSTIKTALPNIQFI